MKMSGMCLSVGKDLFFKCKLIGIWEKIISIMSRHWLIMIKEQISLMLINIIIAKSGNTMSGDLNMGSNQISGLFQIPLTLFQLPPNTTDTNMQKICFESYQKYNL